MADQRRLGVMFNTDRMDGEALVAFARQVEATGIDTMWVPELFGREPFVASAHLLACTDTLRVATGIANVYARDAVAAAAGAASLAEFSAGRFVLGLGVSNAGLAGARGHAWEPPVERLADYLDAIAAAPVQVPGDLRAPVHVAAHGPRMLEMSASHADGAHPYFTTPDHTETARQIMGPDKFLAPEIMCVLETDPARFLPEATDRELSGQVVGIDLNQPMSEIRNQLTQYPVKTRLSLSGSLVVARDIAHAKIKERLDAGDPMPEYLREYPVYYAGPAKTPEGYASGSFGPTTASRMDPYVDEFQAAGGSMVMLAKGNRSAAVTEACAKHGGFYLGSIGGPAARLAKDSIRKVEVLEYPELGMEAIWRIEVEDFPAFIVVDDKGNDFYAQVTTPVSIG